MSMYTATLPGRNLAIKFQSDHTVVLCPLPGREDGRRNKQDSFASLVHLMQGIMFAFHSPLHFLASTSHFHFTIPYLIVLQ